MTYKNIRLHPILRIIYFCLRVYAWVSTNVFYRRRSVLGSENLDFDGPAIIVTNHPSTLMDVLNVGISIRQEMFFLANYGLFKHPVSNWILSRLYCIPVKRREDVEEGQERNNDAAFEMSFRHLEADGLLFIAAEGVSWMNRWVRPFKTGTARIAFGAQNRNIWTLDLKIIPVGLSYNAANLFRSEVVVQYGKPISTTDWEAAWKQNPEQAVDDFTLLLENSVRALSIDARDESGEKILGHWEEILQNSLPVSGKASFYRSQALTKRHLDEVELRQKTENYYGQLSETGVRDAGVALQAAGGLRASDGLLLLLGFPFFLAGYLFWFLPCYLPGLLAKKLKLYIGYDSNVKTIAGTLTFWVALAWAPWLLGAKNQWSATLAVFLCIGLAYFAEWYAERGKRWLAYRRLRSRDIAVQRSVGAQRQEILQKLIS